MPYTELLFGNCRENQHYLAVARYNIAALMRDLERRLADAPSPVKSEALVRLTKVYESICIAVDYDDDGTELGIVGEWEGRRDDGKWEFGTVIPVSVDRKLAAYKHTGLMRWVPGELSVKPEVCVKVYADSQTAIEEARVRIAKCFNTQEIENSACRDESVY